MTRRTIQTSFCAAVALCASAVMAAQTPAPSQQTTQTPQANASTADNTVTVTGCLKDASSMSTGATPGTSTAGVGATGTAGTTATGTAGADTPQTPSSAAPATADAAKYVLTNATISRASADTSGAAGAGATGTTGTSGAAAGAATGTAGSGQTYRLIANPAALGEHVGKKLELTGVLEDQKGGTETATTGDAGMPALRVQSGKIVGNSCTP